MPGWVKELLDDWLRAANLKPGNVFRRVNKNGKVWGHGLTEKAVWHVMREYAWKTGIEELAPHDLRKNPCPAISRGRQRTGTDPVPSRARVHSDGRALPGLQTAHSIGRKRPDRHRAARLSGRAEPDACRVAGDSFRMQNSEYEQTV
jgi:integrase